MVFLICDTKIRHELASSEYNIRRETCAAAADKMGKPSLRDASIHDLESKWYAYKLLLWQTKWYRVGVEVHGFEIVLLIAQSTFKIWYWQEFIINHNKFIMNSWYWAVCSAGFSGGENPKWYNHT